MRAVGRPARGTPEQALMDQLGRAEVDQLGRTRVDQLARSHPPIMAPPGWTSLAGLRVDLIRRAATPARVRHDRSGTWDVLQVETTFAQQSLVLAVVCIDSEALLHV